MKTLVINSIDIKTFLGIVGCPDTKKENIGKDKAKKYALLLIGKYNMLMKSIILIGSKK